MIWPLHCFHREGLRVPGVWSLLAFFSSLGVGFMFIEMGLIQRLNLFLGHPMYSLSIVLAGLLLFTGVGSYMAGTLTWRPSRLLTVGMLGTAGTVMAWSLVMNIIIPITFKQPSTVRVVVTLVSLLPVGLMMGIPFATGLRLLQERHERFIPWVWGINGLTSVMASILAIILAMRVGFQFVLILGAITYFLGWVAVRHFLNSASPAEQARAAHAQTIAGAGISAGGLISFCGNMTETTSGRQLGLAPRRSLRPSRERGREITLLKCSIKKLSSD